jgi:hypothetical protein
MEMLAQFGYSGELAPWAYYSYGIILLTMAFGLALNLTKPEKAD